MDVLNFIIVLIVGMAGGFFNVFVGAGSLLTIPVLIFFGLPPHAAIATNRLGVTGSDIAGWYEFHVKRMINYRASFTLALPALVGAIAGANLVLEIKPDVLKSVIALITLVVLAIVIATPDAGIRKRTGNHVNYVTAVIASLAVGVYGGFYGAGAGTFLFYILILCFGETFVESAGTHEPANLAFSLTAVVIFAINDVINYRWAIPLFIGSFSGAFVSAFYSDKISNIWLKKLFIAVVMISVIKLLLM
jgi:uncharacterized membrane protein YfcA